jgi:hypothetical protein
MGGRHCRGRGNLLGLGTRQDALALGFARYRLLSQAECGGSSFQPHPACVLTKQASGTCTLVNSGYGLAQDKGKGGVDLLERVFFLFVFVVLELA